MGKHHKRLTRITGLGLCALALMLCACGDDDGELVSGKPDSGAADSGPEREDAARPDCVEDPETHLEIINACTDSDYVDKDPELPLLLPDGGLPPLP